MSNRELLEALDRVRAEVSEVRSRVEGVERRQFAQQERHAKLFKEWEAVMRQFGWER